MATIMLRRLATSAAQVMRNYNMELLAQRAQQQVAALSTTPELALPAKKKCETPLDKCKKKAKKCKKQLKTCKLEQKCAKLAAKKKKSKKSCKKSKKSKKH